MLTQLAKAVEAVQVWSKLLSWWGGLGGRGGGGWLSGRLVGSNGNETNHSPAAAGAKLNFAIDYFGSRVKAKMSSPPAQDRVKMSWENEWKG